MQTTQGLLLVAHNMEVSAFTFRSFWCIAGRHDMLLIAMKASLRVLHCCILTRKANQRLVDIYYVLWIPVPAVQSNSGGKQP